jgi:orotidine-5'-phosphate decarboxylase
MLAAAAQAAGDEIGILAVTVLTSLEGADLERIGFARGPLESATTLAHLAAEAGCAGCVCSPHEVATLRGQLARPWTLVVPGIRPPGSAPGDQRRTATPTAALSAGADLLVVGRPVVAAIDPLASLDGLLEECLRVSLE